MTKPATIEIDRMKAYEWMTNGAQPTETVRAILRFKGILFYKHLQRGVKKGAMTPEDAEIKFRAWVDDKEARIEARVQATAAERKDRAAQISGSKRTLKKKVEESDNELLNVNLAESAAAETANDEVVNTTEETTAPAEETAAPSEETATPSEETTAAPEETVTAESTDDTATKES
jgi:small subunit ribosomal protein S16